MTDDTRARRRPGKEDCGGGGGQATTVACAVVGPVDRGLRRSTTWRHLRECVSAEGLHTGSLPPVAPEGNGDSPHHLRGPPHPRRARLPRNRGQRTGAAEAERTGCAPKSRGVLRQWARTTPRKWPPVVPAGAHVQEAPALQPQLREQGGLRHARRSERRGEARRPSRARSAVERPISCPTPRDDCCRPWSSTARQAGGHAGVPALSEAPRARGVARAATRFQRACTGFEALSTRHRSPIRSRLDGLPRYGWANRRTRPVCGSSRTDGGLSPTSCTDSREARRNPLSTRPGPSTLRGARTRTGRLEGSSQRSGCPPAARRDGHRVGAFPRASDSGDGLRGPEASATWGGLKHARALVSEWREAVRVFSSGWEQAIAAVHNHGARRTGRPWIEGGAESPRAGVTLERRTLRLARPPVSIIPGLRAAPRRDTDPTKHARTRRGDQRVVARVHPYWRSAPSRKVSALGPGPAGGRLESQPTERGAAIRPQRLDVSRTAARSASPGKTSSDRAVRNSPSSRLTVHHTMGRWRTLHFLRNRSGPGGRHQLGPLERGVAAGPSLAQGPGDHLPQSSRSRWCPPRAREAWDTVVGKTQRHDRLDERQLPANGQAGDESGGGESLR